MSFPGPRSSSFSSFRLVAVLSRTVVALGALSLSVGTAHAAAVPSITNPTPVSFGSQAVGSAQAQTTVTFTVTGSGTLSTTPLVLTTGQPNLDYTLGTGSTCTGTVSVGTCTVNVIFTPRTPGQRLGAVVLQAGTSTIATALLYGTGTGPAVVFPGNTAINTLGSGFSTPFGVAVDGAGDVYVADNSHGLVKEIVAVGGSIPASNPTINTLVPSGTFNSPYGVAVDGAGNVYVADTSHSAVKEIVAVGGSIPASNPTVLTLGPSGTFSHPYGVAVDGAGNVYVSDYANNAVKEIPLATPPSVTFASTSVGNTSSDSPQTLTLQNIGNTSLTFPIPASGTSPAISSNYTLSGSGTCPQLTTSTSAAQTLAPGTCTAVVSFTPVMPSAAAGSIIFTDNSNNATNATQTVTLTGTATAATGATAQTITFPQPTTPAQAGTMATLTASSSSGLAIIYSVVSGPATLSGSTVTYTGAGTVVLEADQYGSNTYSAATAVQRTVTVQTGVGAAGPTQTATVTITTAGTPGTISVVTQGATGLDFTFVSGGTCSTSTAYTIGQSCTVEYTFTPSATGPRYGAVVLSSGTTVLGTSYLGGVGTGPVAGFTQSSFSGAADGVGGNVQYPALVLGGTSPNPTGTGNVLYIPNNSNVLYKDTIGTGTAAFYTGAGTARYRGAGVDGAGNVYVSDVISNNVFKLSSSGTLLATWPVSGVSLSSPWGMVFGTDGTLYVANPGANDIVAITPAGVASVLPVSGYSFTAYSLAIDGSNNLYIPDNANSRILKVPGNSGAGGAAALVSVTGTAISGPASVAIDSAGELYVTESNSTVLRISAAGVSAAVPETGLSSSAGVVTDNRGHVYVTDAAVASLFTLTLASPPALSFGSVAVGSSSTAQAMTLLNSGNASLSLASVTASTANFTGSLGTCGATLASGISCAPSFAFTPQSATALTGNGIVTDNSLNVSGSTQTVALSGTGTPGTVTFGTMNFSPAATEPQGTSQIISISEAITYGGVQPTGAVTFVLNGVTYTATCTTASSPETCTATVPAGTIAALAMASYTVTAALAQDSTYNASTGTSGTFSITTPLVITVPSNIIAEATYAAGAVVTYTATANDGYDGTITPSCAPASGSTFALGTTQVTCTATDSHSNHASKSFTVTVQDTTAPTITTPSNMTVEATGPAGAVATYSATATDAVDGTDSVTCAPVSGSTFALGTTQVTCSSTDAHGNKATKSFTVTVQDTTAPVITTPSNQTVEATTPAGAVVNFTATATDAVDGTDSVTCSPVSGSTFAIGMTQVTCSSTDAHGNKATKSFTVTVVGPAVTSISPTFGPVAGGTTVTISGSGFTGVTGVRFGGVAATGVVFNSDSSITATSPALAGTNAVVDVTVTTGVGTTATSSADQFTYVVPASYTAPTTAVGVTSATQTAYLTITMAGTPSTISVVMQGATGLDFTFVSGGTCSTSTAYTIGQVCTVEYTFTPSATGPRYGAVVLSSGATVLGTSYLGGTGTGPVAGFTQSSFSGAADGVGGNVQYPALVLGGTSPNPTGTGNILYIPNNSNVLYQDTVGTGTAAFYTGAGSARYRGAGVDGAGNVYVSDVISNNVFKLSSSGTLLATWPVSGVSLSSPWGMVFGTDGTLYVANPGANDIVAITPAGVASVLPVSGYSFTAYSLAIDGSNNLYIPDNANSRILKVPGNSGAGGAAALVSVTGTAISGPSGVAIDSAGELYVTENNSTVLRISAAGVSAAVPETGLSSSAGVVTDNRGHVYVTDAAVASLFTLTLASPPALSFGSVAVGSSSTAQGVTLLNSGNASLSLASVTASTANFTGALGTCGATLASGISCAPSFAFTPQSATALTGNGIVTDNSLNVSGSTQTVALSGTGTPAPTITSYSPNPVPGGGGVTVTATGTTLSGTTNACIYSTGGSIIDCDSVANVTATSFTFVTSSSVGAGTYCLRAGSSTGNPCISYTVAASVFGGLTVTGYASPAILKEGGTVTVTAKYANGSLDPLFTGTVTLTSSDANATLPTAYTFTSGEHGVHTFNVALNTRGTQSITATSGSVSGSQAGIVVGDAVWLLNAAGTLTKLNEAGAAVTTGIGSTGSAATRGGAAFDSAGDAWSVNAGSNSLLFSTSLSTGVTTYTGGGLNAPVSVAVDGAGYVWIANSGNNTVSAFNNSGTAASPSQGYGSSYVAGQALSAPSAIVIDKTGGVWVANKTGNSVTHVFGAAKPVVTPLSSATVNGTLGTQP